MNIEERIRRGHGVDALLRDENVAAVFKALQDEYHRDWLRLPRDQADLIRYKALALLDLQTSLVALRDDGLKAQHEAQSLARRVA